MVLPRLSRRRPLREIWNPTRVLVLVLCAICLAIAMTNHLMKLDDLAFIARNEALIQYFLPQEESSKTILELPEACRALSSSRSRDLPKRPPIFRDAKTTEDIPPEFVKTEPIHPYKPMSFIMRENNKVHNPEIPLKSLPTNVTLICVPDGIVVYSGIAGPYRDDEPNPINVQQSKRWFAGATGVTDFAKRKPVIQDIPGLGVQVSGWTTFTWNHFAGDTLVRLGLVYDALISDDPLWGNAKIVVNTNLEGDYGGITFDAPVEWLYEKLNLTQRLIPNNGWLVKANHTTRFDHLVIPDVTPQPMCGPNDHVVDPIFPRGVLRPIQRALGITESSPKKYIVYASRRDANKRRAVEEKRRDLILRSIREMLKDINSDLEVVERTFRDHPDAMVGVMRHAAVVVGPHGANLWNAAFAPPGGLLVEFSTVKAEFLDKDCRTYAFSLANAAGLSYALVETKNFGYENENLMPEAEDVVAIIKAFLLGETA